MPTLEDVKAQIEALGETDTFGTKKEIGYLPEILGEGETIVALTSGLMDGNTWLITSTDRRIIFLDKGMLYGLKQSEIPLDKINSIGHKTGIVFGEIEVWDGAGKTQIKNILKATVKPFVAATTRAIEARQGDKATPGAGGSDVVSQLERLAALKERGILSEQEFADQKAKILAL